MAASASAANPDDRLPEARNGQASRDPHQDPFLDDFREFAAASFERWAGGDDSSEAPHSPSKSGVINETILCAFQGRGNVLANHLVVILQRLQADQLSATASEVLPLCSRIWPWRR